VGLSLLRNRTFLRPAINFDPLFDCLICLFYLIPPDIIPRWHKHCTNSCCQQQNIESSRGGEMKELANSLAQLAAIVMILITLAVSTAAVAQWASADTDAANKGSAKQQTLVASEAR
jgi:hypothetical protein